MNCEVCGFKSSDVYQKYFIPMKGGFFVGNSQDQNPNFRYVNKIKLYICPVCFTVRADKKEIEGL